MPTSRRTEVPETPAQLREQAETAVVDHGILGGSKYVFAWGYLRGATTDTKWAYSRAQLAGIAEGLQLGIDKLNSQSSTSGKQS